MKSIAFLAFVASIALSNVVSAQTSACAAQQILDTCLVREKEYFQYCKSQTTDYACLCKVNTALLTCYDNCPQDLGKSTYQGLKDTYCSIAQTYNTTSLPSASVVTNNNLPSNSIPTTTIPLPSTSNNNTNTTSMSTTNNNYQMSQGVVMMITGIITAWYLV